MSSRRFGATPLFLLIIIMSGCVTAQPFPLRVGLVTITGAQVRSPRTVPPHCMSANNVRPQSSTQTMRAAEYQEIIRKLHETLSNHFVYPELARQYLWQGTTEICGTLAQDGKIVHVAVASSSGNAFLDNESVGLIRSVGSIKLDHALSSAQTRFLIPIAYNLIFLSPDQQTLINIVRDRLLINMHYPAAAIASKLEGNVVLSAVLQDDGSLQNVELYDSSGSELLDQAARDLLEGSVPFPIQRVVHETPAYLVIPIAYRFDHSIPGSSDSTGQ
ncbi:hypothetical protein DNFV4_00522 [Nitrospira tepida]|uniref:TonB C-terminal domain-containing protein n=1 Tax=Nitrospira tepida TaxID=2973512 RepID=A0AA86T940_9BACT|nr:hypothetical protein DNFV4_00522 [Nitrospira tepida]